MSNAPKSTPVTFAVEGNVDAAVISRILHAKGLIVGTQYVAHGKARLLQRLDGYVAASQHAPWVVVADLDSDYECAPAARIAWLPGTSQNLCFRIAVRAIEAWLLADVDSLAGFLRVRPTQLPAQPENEQDPKRKLVDIARQSRRSAIREDMVPRDGSGTIVGPAYTSRIIEYVENHWNPATARLNSPSLDGFMRCLERLAQAQSPT